ncbi:MAG: condensation domain-containing protein, partial [Cyclobacteriaceae bacterium]
MLDGWSVSVFNAELTKLLSRRGDGTLPALKHTYADYCALLLARSRAADIDIFWKKTMCGYTRNKLPYNYKGLRISDQLGMRCASRQLGLDLLNKLQLLAQRHQVSLKSICLAAHTLLMHVVAAENDVVTGFVSHDRPEIEDGDKILGCFLNTVPVRINFDKINDVESLLKYTHSYLVEVKAREIHLGDVVRIIDEKVSSVNPIFDTLLNFTDFHSYYDVNSDSGVVAFNPGWKQASIGDSKEMTNTLFDVEVDKTLDQFSVRIKFTPAYFTDDQVKSALELYANLLTQIADEPNAPLASLSLLSDCEYQAVVLDFNNTFRSYADTRLLHQLFEDRVAEVPDYPALVQHGVTLTYRQLNERANRLARLLLEYGVTTSENVGVLTSRSFDMIIGMLAVLKAGG